MKNNETHLKFFGIGSVLPYLGHVKGQIIIMLTAAFLGSLADILLPQFQKYALDEFVTEKNFSAVGIFTVAYLLTLLGAAIVNYISCSLATTVEMRINQRFRNTLFTHLQTLSLSYYNQNSVGYIHSRLMSDTSRIGSLFSWTLFDAFWRLLNLLGFTAVMFYMNARLALLVLSVLPLLVILFAVFQAKLIGVNREIRESNSKITGKFNEGIVGAKTIKSLAIEPEMAKRFCGETETMYKKSVRAARLHGLFSGFMDFGASAAIAIVLWKGGYIAESDIGTFSVFMTYAGNMIEPVRFLVRIFAQLITTQVNIERVTNLLETKPLVTDSDEVRKKYGGIFDPKKENWESVSGDICFSHVYFTYPDGNEEVLSDFSLNIKEGAHIAIVGETGAGKSTLVNLLCRFYEPTKGKILIGGRDIKERSALWLHSQIGYVLQTPHLFSGTLRDNLLSVKPDATEEEIASALRLVNADEIVSRLPDGIDTPVGEGGDILSVGEKQLISFARAVLSDPKILILDEATASVDTLTEGKIQSAMESITKNRTSVMIAHRLSTVKEADLIIAVKDGVIAEMGTHSGLLKKGGYYKELYTRQFEEDVTNEILK